MSIALQLLLHPILHEQAVFVAFAPAVIAGAIVGGAATALGVTGLGLIAGLAVAGPALARDSVDLAVAILFIAFGAAAALAARRFGRRDAARVLEDLTERE
ncbi:MAG TPA: hypothetical protein VHN39_10175, partial [Phenylobacterium sp.]|nr:hypothetical protein [Phenylobacterium sp.]